MIKFSASMETAFDQVASALHETDPEGLLVMGAPADEYYPEIPGIVHAVGVSKSESDLLLRVYQVFLDWFGPETIESVNRYEPLVDALWPHVQERLERRRSKVS